MQLGKASAYGVLAAVYIAQHQGRGPVQGRVIAEAHGIPAEYLLKILQQMVRGGVLRSETGRRGGFDLVRPAADTNLLDVVEAIDGPLQGTLTVGEAIHDADSTVGRMQAMCQDIARDARERLRNTSIRDLCTGGDSVEAAAGS